MPDKRVILVRWTTQFRHQHGRRERAVSHLLTHVEVITTQDRAGASKVKLTSSSNVVLEVVRTLIIEGRVDTWANIHSGLPVEIIMRVVALCDPDVYSADAWKTLTLKEH